MRRALPFARLVHADWSANPPGRWAAQAVRRDRGWRAEALFPVPPLDRFVDDLFAAAREGPVLAGFDFPIGLPAGFGAQSGFAGFTAALDGFGVGDWDRFYDVAETRAEISRHRPFYPRRAGGSLRQHLLEGHGVASIDALTRRCERGGPGRRPAGCLFWTLGASQVGRAALAGWRGVVVPALARGARLWPFHGDLAELANHSRVTLAETYPADVYARLGAGFRSGESKRRQEDRIAKAGALFGWARTHDVALSRPLADAVRDGFGAQDKGGDRFDAVIGLFGMIAVADGRDCEGAPQDDEIRRWEGWILGRQA